MIQITPQMRILVAVEPDGLSPRHRRPGPRLQRGAAARSVQRLGKFVFRNRPATALKILVYDGQGFWLCHKQRSNGKVPLVAAPRAQRRGLWRPTSCRFSWRPAIPRPPRRLPALATSRPRQLMPMLVRGPSLLLRARKRVALIFSISCGFGYAVCPYGSSGGKRNRRDSTHGREGDSRCRGACGNAIMVLANPIIIELDMGKLEDLLQRIDTQDLCAEDWCHDPFRDRVL